MKLREMALKAQTLRRQLTELQAKVEQTRQALDQANAELRGALQGSGDDVSEFSEEEFQMILAGYNDPTRITVEVVCATRDKQLCNEIQLSRGATIEDGIHVSGVLDAFPEIDLAKVKVGIHGSVRPRDHVVKEGDRIEIYRPVEPAA